MVWSVEGAEHDLDFAALNAFDQVGMVGLPVAPEMFRRNPLVKRLDGGVHQLRGGVTDHDPAGFANTIDALALLHRFADDFDDAAGRFTTGERPHQTSDEGLGSGESLDGWDGSVFVLDNGGLGCHGAEAL